MSRLCLPSVQAHQVGVGLDDARYAFNDTSKWWERLFRIGPAASLSKELGVHHSISWDTFLHYACLVSPAPLLQANDCRKQAALLLGLPTCSAAAWGKSKAASCSEGTGSEALSAEVQVNSYAFACERPWGHIGTCMVPMLDMLNHRCSSCITTFIHMQHGMGAGMLLQHGLLPDSACFHPVLPCRRAGVANAMVSQHENRSFSCVAVQDIRKGEEVGETAHGNA